MVGWPYAEFEVNKADIEGNYLKMFEFAPEFAERIGGATRAARLRRYQRGELLPQAIRSGFFLVLVGDAGYNKDFITAQGISDAFRDAQLCATALHEWLSGSRSFDVAMGEYQSKRDEHVLAMFDFTTQLATLENATTRDAAAARCSAWKPGGHGWVCAGQRGRNLTSAVLFRGEHRSHLRCGDRPLIKEGELAPDESP